MYSGTNNKNKVKFSKPEVLCDFRVVCAVGERQEKFDERAVGVRAALEAYAKKLGLVDYTIEEDRDAKMRYLKIWVISETPIKGLG